MLSLFGVNTIANNAPLRTASAFYSTPQRLDAHPAAPPSARPALGGDFASGDLASGDLAGPD